jgi:hypothetical protein
MPPQHLETVHEAGHIAIPPENPLVRALHKILVVGDGAKIAQIDRRARFNLLMRWHHTVRKWPGTHGRQQSVNSLTEDTCGKLHLVQSIVEIACENASSFLAVNRFSHSPNQGRAMQSARDAPIKIE